MPPIRPFILLFSVVLFSTCLLFLSLAGASESYSEETDHTRAEGGLSAYFSFRNPASLFTPTATISITDDNSTYFAARPAAFGPILPPEGLSGELWLGCGFAGDSFGRHDLVGSTEGELGCSDIPGWSVSGWLAPQSTSTKAADGRNLQAQDEDDDPFDGPLHQEYNPPQEPAVRKRDGTWLVEDGTDNYLHYPLEDTYIPTAEKLPQRHTAAQALAMSSLSDARSEISGKIVLLSRGGCGFAEKVKWAQRRGANAVIVGDNLRGGPLVRMYARGDTSNITIPSLFTSHTSAHLISSLVPAYLGPSRHVRPGDSEDYATRSTAVYNKPGTVSHSKNAGMFYAMWSTFRPTKNNDFEKRQSNRHTRKSIFKRTQSSDLKSANHDRRHNFESGPLNDLSHPSYPTSPPELEKISKVDQQNAIHQDDSQQSSTPAQRLRPGPNRLSNDAAGTVPHLLFTDDSSGHFDNLPFDRLWPGGEKLRTPRVGRKGQGLWVTLTPTNMSTSPFFNTLFVLVVSPLVTLAVVYSMLLLRSRIRRRRWRAPKSVVERLPVRIYRALSARSGSSPTGSTSGGPSQTTPLLADSRLNEQQSQTFAQPSSQTPQIAPDYGSVPPTSNEKSESGLAGWKRKYGSKQVECVVCLEEYVDGVSRVMSLPCGHEFHVDCITPWLTTRRRTCPICKGDVVRSLDRDISPADSPISEEFDEEDMQTHVAQRTNRSPSSYLPIPQLPTHVRDHIAGNNESPASIQSAPPARSQPWLSRSSTRGATVLGRGALPPPAGDSIEDNRSTGNS